jgi:flagellar hook assembly protein FlgD
MTENGVEPVTVEIFNIQGRFICTLVDGMMSPGLHQAYWNGTSDNGISVANGIYFYRMQAGSFHETKRMVLLK